MSSEQKKLQIISLCLSLCLTLRDLSLLPNLQGVPGPCAVGPGLDQGLIDPQLGHQHLPGWGHPEAEVLSGYVYISDLSKSNFLIDYKDKVTPTHQLSPHNDRHCPQVELPLGKLQLPLDHYLIINFSEIRNIDFYEKIPPQLAEAIQGMRRGRGGCQLL